MEKKSVQYIAIDANHVDQRIDNFLITFLKGVPKTHIYRIIRKGEVRVNKKRISPSYRLQFKDKVRLPPLTTTLKKMKELNPAFSEFLLQRILYEDPHLIILNKPKGLPVHGGNQVSMGVIEALRTLFPSSTKLELAHRLDLDTSGCLVITKKMSVLRELHALFREGLVKKVYWALTYGHWKANELKVNIPLEKNHLKSGERIVRVNPAGKNSLTYFKSLKKFKNMTLVECTLATGRTHQIRVHASYKGHPIAGDEKYGDSDFNKLMRKNGLKRLFLHAYQIEFTLKGAAHPIKVRAPLDEDLAACLKVLE